MKDSVHLRAARSGDINQLTDIMFHTWYEDEASAASDDEVYLLRMMARYDVAHYSETSTHVMVAVDDDASSEQRSIVGAAMWRNDTDWEQGVNQQSIVQADLEEIVALRSSNQEFAARMQIFEDDAVRTHDLAQSAAQSSGAELRLFMIAPHARGLGVGKQLLASAENSMRLSGARRYYLYTDSECDYSFYDHRGMTRATQALQVPGPGGRIVDKFIYMQNL
ncbi:GNAT family N-acetyltransferase [Alloscardovia omnicolens]|uniref:GNAT family N-acetyltransferase n=1 Tax=Alloscardovia omnicolens TaxID=419015 RepID=UPI003A70F5EA